VMDESNSRRERERVWSVVEACECELSNWGGGVGRGETSGDKNAFRNGLCEFY
jgi:hypothetical protein